MQCHIFFYGIVQGVGFREHTRRMARSLNITGWVKNLRDGSVEAMMRGDPESVDKLIEYCKSNIPDTIVTDVKSSYLYEEDFYNFKIIK